MNETEIIEKLKSEGFDPVYAYDAEPGEVDEEHAHDYDTLLAIVRGSIEITVLSSVTTLYEAGSEAFIPRMTPHIAKVGAEGCRYIVAEKHS